MTKATETLLEGNAGISIASALSILRKRKWMIAGLLLTIPTVVGVVVSKQPKVYQTSTSLVIDSTVPQYLGQSFKDVVEIETNWWTAQETLQTELRVIKSHSQALAVAKALCDKHVGPDKIAALKKLIPGATCTDPNDYEKAAPILQSLVRIEPVKDSRVVNLIVENRDAEMAAVLANTMAQIYTDRNLEHRLSQSQGAASWLGDEYGDLTVQLNDAERALIDFKKKYNVVAVGIEDQQNDLSFRRKKIAEELNATDVKLIGVRSLREQYAALKSNDPMEQVTPGVADSPVMMKLKELYVDQYARLLEMRGKYLEKHPTVIAQEARVAAIKADLEREAGLALKTVEATFSALNRQQQDLKSTLDSVTRESLQLEQRAIEYNRLKRNFDRLSKLSDQVGGRERETSLAGHLKTNNVRILDAAIIPRLPISPNIPNAMGVAALLAFLVSIGLSFLLEILDATVKTQDDVEKATGLVFLGLIPRISANKGPEAPAPPALAKLVQADSRDLHVLAHPKSAVAECCRAIRTNLLFMTPDKPAKTLLITSAGPQEGKTTSAINLAIIMAQSGLRVLLVDTDMRRPRLHKAFGIPATPDGISRAILGEADPLEMVRETGVPNLLLLPCGALPPNPAELLHAERFKAIVERLSGAFDRVIFDSPPVGAVTDAAILSRLTHGTVLIAKSGKTSKDTLSLLARRLLTDTGVNVLGCILNDLDLSKQGNYGYYYYSRYGYYSGYGDGADPPSKGGPAITDSSSG